MGYHDATITIPAMADHLLARAGRRDVSISAQPAQFHGSRTVILRIVEKNGKRAVYEIPLEEWSRLNRDAIKTP